jgi:hypothetical protein
MEKQETPEDSNTVDSSEIHEDKITLGSESDSNVKILGVSWNVESDEFEYDLSNLAEYGRTLTPTKHSVLKVSAKIFDPLGFFSAFTIVMKVLFQLLCKESVVWDDPLTGKALDTWNQIFDDLSSLKPCALPNSFEQSNSIRAAWIF